jgi:ribonuclease HI
MQSAAENKFFQNILIFTDGACSGNPGPGGWGAIIADPAGKVKELGGSADHTTNNRMELAATIRALDAIKSQKGLVYFFTDSTYVIRGITQWIWGWRKRGWVNAEGKEVLNRDLWEDLFSLVMDRGTENKIDWHYSRGHVGTPGNERCDEIAVAFSQGKWVNLYEGPLLKYSVAIYDLPEDSSLPEMKPKLEKKKAYSYLSYLNGVVYRHWDWPSCERRVKGQSGAKFKKALTADEEIKILEEWKIDPDIEIKE